MRLTCVVILSLFAVPIYAATNSAPFQDWVGKTVEAVQKADLYSTTRNGLFCSSGDGIDTIKIKERVRILGYSKVSCGLFFTFEFFQIERTSPGVQPGKRIGFVRATDDKTPRFQLISSESSGE